MHFHKLALCALIVLFVTGCSVRRINSGYQYENADLQSIVKLQSTSEDVNRILGTPTVTSDFGPKTFFYMGAKYDKIAFFDPKLIEQKIIAISFNNNDVVSDIRFYGTEDSRMVVFSKDSIVIKGNEVSLFRQLFRNLGRFNRSPSNL